MYVIMPCMFIPVFIALLTTVLKVPPLWEKKFENPIKQNIFEILKKSRMKKGLLLGLLISAVQQFTGINHIIWEIGSRTMQSNVRKTVNLEAANVSVILLGWNSVSALCAGAILYWAPKGRRKFIIPSTFMMSIGALITGVCFYLDDISLSFIGIGIFIFFFEIGPGTLFWIVCCEIFPGYLMALGFPIVNSIQLLFSSIVVLGYMFTVNYPGYAYQVLWQNQIVH
eukprot:NODE_3879_length_1270_cov_23.011334_g3400_i0.p1 GENE.NODE_3879_length_1270_cov_23.011334_g3400_i0~~NODE_3879_length_1270_cov_23.011334_g3400_i0.p1  ORF type:complete len:226 (-),score=26.36 NODE_3879_length_1270_cov_23.011334_g3400_i0:304-981(-)